MSDKNENIAKTAGKLLREDFWDKKKNRKFSSEIKAILEKHKKDVEAFVSEAEAARKILISNEAIKRISDLAREVET